MDSESDNSLELVTDIDPVERFKDHPAMRRIDEAERDETLQRASLISADLFMSYRSRTGDDVSTDPQLVEALRIRHLRIKERLDDQRLGSAAA